MKEDKEIPDLSADSKEEKKLIVIAPRHKQQTLKKITSKSLILILANGIVTSSEFTKIYLLSQLGVKSIGTSVITATTTSFTIDTAAILTNQSVVFIAEKYGLIQKLSLETAENIVSTQLEIDSSRAAIGAIIRQSWRIGIFASAPVIIILFSIKPILQIFRQSEEISALAGEYFFPIAFTVPLKIILNINERVLPAVNKEKLLVPFTIGMVITGTALSVVLIPNFGMSGVGFTLAIQNLIGFICSLLFYRLDPDLRTYRVFDFSSRSTAPSYVTKILKQGLPLAVQQFVLSGSGFSLSLLMGNLGPERLAIEQIIGLFFSIPTVVTRNINDACNRLIAQAIGEKKYREMRRYGNLGLIASTTLLTATAISYNVFPLALSSVFLDEETVAQEEDLIRYSFIFASIGKFFEVIQDASGLNLAGMQDTFLSSFSLISSALLVVLPLVAINNSLTDFDLYGVNAAILIGFMLAGGTTLRQWLKLSNEVVAKDDFDSARDTSNVYYLSKLTRFFTRVPANQENSNDLEVFMPESDFNQSSDSNNWGNPKTFSPPALDFSP